MNIQAVMMVRNEIDIISASLTEKLGLFDRLLVADMQSTDGTREVVDAYADATKRVDVYNFPYLARQQAECLSCLSKIAFKSHADWVFFLDADEFLKVENRADLESYLLNCGSQIVHLPWINLIPTEYGTFSDFDIDQEFSWTGRLSTYSKVAVSGHYYLSNPDFVLEAGNHNVRRNLSCARPEDVELGFPLYHVPIRSVERIKYKAANSLVVDSGKHNRRTDEAGHLTNLHEILGANEVTPELLNGMCMDYGEKAKIAPVDPKKLDWPSAKLAIPATEIPKLTISPLNALGLREKDKSKSWRSVNQPLNATVGAMVDNGELILLPQSVRGNGGLGPLRFPRLAPGYVDPGVSFDEKAILKALCSSLIRPPFNVFSAWTDLVPALGMIFSTMRPRRFVELGTHNGMSFFSACQFSEFLKTNTQCIAVDSWEGDPHAGTHSPEVFTNFQSNLRSRFPSQIYLRTFFQEAAHAFDEGSIDLIHIDGFHSYEAVRSDFETWLPKMSDRGVMIFHDTNVHRNDFGVWQFWEEVTKSFPSIELKHGHGLGILYVGKENSDVSEVFEYFRTKPDYQTFLKTFLEAQIEAIRIEKANPSNHVNGITAERDRITAERDRITAERDRITAERDKLSKLLVERTEALNMIATDKWWRRTRHFRRWSNSIRKLRGRPKKKWPGPVL